MASGFESTFLRVLQGPKEYKTTKAQRDFMARYRARKRKEKKMRLAHDPSMDNNQPKGKRP